jgi:hypothetical protein
MKNYLDKFLRDKNKKQIKSLAEDFKQIGGKIILDEKQEK